MKLTKRNVLYVALCLTANAASAQLAIGNRGLTIKAGTTLYADSLVLVPGSNHTLSNTVLSKSYIPLAGLGTNTISRVYSFSTPLHAYTGSIGMYYHNTELYGNRASWLAIAYSADSTKWKASRNGGAAGNFIATPSMGITGDTVQRITALNSSNFYSQSTGDITNAATWGENADGSGIAAADFSNPFNNFVLSNRTGTVMLPADWQLRSELDIDANVDLNISTRNLTAHNLVTIGTLSGNRYSNLTIKGTANGLRFNSSASLLGNFVVDTAAFVTLSDTLKLTAGTTPGLLTVRGTLNANGLLVLLSDSLGTARIGNSTGTINGDVKCMQYVQGGRRAYRFWAHPFSNYIPLSQIQNYIDVTGVGGATNGFVPTASNSPSCYWYHTVVGNSTLGADPGWKPFNSCFGVADTDKFHRYEGIRLYIRGAKGQGLGYAVPTPLPVTIGMWGPVNTGNQSIPLARGVDTTKEYNLIGNPYASPVDIGTVIANARDAGKIRGAAFYVWNPYRGTAGGFEPKTIGSSYVIQAYNSFQVRAAYNGATLDFTESNKASAAPQVLLKSEEQYTTLQVYDSAYRPWDITYINFTDDATNAEDRMADAGKLSNPDFNFYSLSQDEQRLSIDSRPFKHGISIPLGFSSNFAQTYIIRADRLVLPPNGKLYLYDKHLDKKIELTPGAEYKFQVNEDTATQGNARFELQTVDVEKTIENPVVLNIAPNPATDEISVSFKVGNTENARMRILDMAGVCVATKELGTRLNGVVKFRLDRLAAGIYMLEFTTGNNKTVQKFVKQ